MSINFENYLHKLDLALSGKEQKELYMTYVMIAAGIFAFSYLLFWDSSLKGFNVEGKKISKLQTNINKDKSFLRINPAYKITRLDKKIANINKEIALNKKKNDYIKKKIETISSLIYDERSWGKYLDSIAINAQKYHIKLLTLTNEYAKSDSSFGHILDITVDSQGNFKDTLKFINSLEKSDLVVDIHDFKINATTSLKSNLNISVWGITY